MNGVREESRKKSRVYGRCLPSQGHILSVRVCEYDVRDGN